MTFIFQCRTWAACVGGVTVATAISSDPSLGLWGGPDDWPVGLRPGGQPGTQSAWTRQGCSEGSQLKGGTVFGFPQTDQLKLRY